MTTYTCTLEIDFDKKYKMPEQTKKCVENCIDAIFCEMEAELLKCLEILDDYIDLMNGSE